MLLTEIEPKSTVEPEADKQPLDYESLRKKAEGQKPLCPYVVEIADSRQDPYNTPSYQIYEVVYHTDNVVAVSVDGYKLENKRHGKVYALSSDAEKEQFRDIMTDYHLCLQELGEEIGKHPRCGDSPIPEGTEYVVQCPIFGQKTFNWLAPFIERFRLLEVKTTLKVEPIAQEFDEEGNKKDLSQRIGKAAAIVVGGEDWERISELYRQCVCESEMLQAFLEAAGTYEDLACSNYADISDFQALVNSLKAKIKSTKFNLKAATSTKATTSFNEQLRKLEKELESAEGKLEVIENGNWNLVKKESEKAPDPKNFSWIICSDDAEQIKGAIATASDEQLIYVWQCVNKPFHPVAKKKRVGFLKAELLNRGLCDNGKTAFSEPKTKDPQPKSEDSEFGKVAELPEHNYQVGDRVIWNGEQVQIAKVTKHAILVTGDQISNWVRTLDEFSSSEEETSTQERKISVCQHQEIQRQPPNIGACTPKDSVAEKLQESAELVASRSGSFSEITDTSLGQSDISPSLSLKESDLPQTETGTIDRLQLASPTDCCIESSGKSTTDRFHSDTTFIISTGTSRTTESTIYSASLHQNTEKFTDFLQNTASEKDSDHTTPKTSNASTQERFTHQQERQQKPLVEIQLQSHKLSKEVTGQQELTGNGSNNLSAAPKRYAWKLENVQPLNPPIPMQGQQGLWNVDPKILDGKLGELSYLPDTQEAKLVTVEVIEGSISLDKPDFYDELEQEDADNLRSDADEIRAVRSNVWEATIYLAEVSERSQQRCKAIDQKKGLKRGTTYDAWVAREFQEEGQDLKLAKQQLERYRRVKRAFEPYQVPDEIMNRIVPGARLKLASENYKAAREEAIDLARCGQKITVQLAQDLIAENPTSHKPKKAKQQPSLPSERFNQEVTFSSKESKYPIEGIKNASPQEIEDLIDKIVHEKVVEALQDEGRRTHWEEIAKEEAKEEVSEKLEKYDRAIAELAKAKSQNVQLQQRLEQLEAKLAQVDESEIVKENEQLKQTVNEYAIASQAKKQVKIKYHHYEELGKQKFSKGEQYSLYKELLGELMRVQEELSIIKSASAVANSPQLELVINASGVESQPQKMPIGA